MIRIAHGHVGAHRVAIAIGRATLRHPTLGVRAALLTRAVETDAAGAVSIAPALFTEPVDAQLTRAVRVARAGDAEASVTDRRPSSAFVCVSAPSTKSRCRSASTTSENEEQTHLSCCSKHAETESNINTKSSERGRSMGLALMCVGHGRVGSAGQCPAWGQFVTSCRALRLAQTSLVGPFGWRAFCSLAESAARVTLHRAYERLLCGRRS